MLKQKVTKIQILRNCQIMCAHKHCLVKISISVASYYLQFIYVTHFICTWLHMYLSKIIVTLKSFIIFGLTA